MSPQTPILFFTFCILCLTSFSIFAKPVIVLNTTGQQPLNTPDMQGFMDLVSSEAFQRINYTLNTVQLPAARGLKNANQGIHDGEMSRVKGLDKIYKNLIRVPESIMDWKFVGFSENDIDLIQGWNALKPYSVSYINGWNILEKNINFANVTKVHDISHLFTLLKKHRTDIIVYELWGGLFYKFDQKLNSIKSLSPPLATRTMFIYLNKRHKKLVIPLSNALKQMKTDGTYQKFYNKLLAPLEM